MDKVVINQLPLEKLRVTPATPAPITTTRRIARWRA
jgi:hypothetical protein